LEVIRFAKAVINEVASESPFRSLGTVTRCSVPIWLNKLHLHNIAELRHVD
jgi:hypothetical protein